MFGWLPQSRPAHGPQLRWRDRIQKDVQLLQLNNWFQVAQDRTAWRAVCSTVPQSVSQPDIRLQCVPPFLLRTSQAWLATSVHRSVNSQFMSKVERGNAVCASAGFAVQLVSPDTSVSQLPQVLPQMLFSVVPECWLLALRVVLFIVITVHGVSSLRRVFARHNCLRGANRTSDRSTFTHACGKCSHRFRRPADIERHKCSSWLCSLSFSPHLEAVWPGTGSWRQGKVCVCVCACACACNVQVLAKSLGVPARYVGVQRLVSIGNPKSAKNYREWTSSTDEAQRRRPNAYPSPRRNTFRMALKSFSEWSNASFYARMWRNLRPLYSTRLGHFFECTSSHGRRRLVACFKQRLAGWSYLWNTIIPISHDQLLLLKYNFDYCCGCYRCWSPLDCEMSSDEDLVWLGKKYLLKAYGVEWLEYRSCTVYILAVRSPVLFWQLSSGTSTVCIMDNNRLVQWYRHMWLF